MSTTREHPGKEQESSPKLDLTVTQVVASSLAAVSAAVASSKLGVGGTIMGAATASAVATVGSAVYSHSIASTRARLKSATTLRPAAHAPSAAPASASAPGGTDGGDALVADPAVTAVLPAQPAEVESSQLESSQLESSGLRGLFSGLPWGRLVLAMVTVFALAFGYLTIAEIGLGRSVAAVVNGEERSGTTLSRVVNPGPAEPTEQDSSDEESSTSEPSSESDPTSDATSDSGESAEPTESASPTSGSGSSDAPSSSATPEPGDQATTPEPNGDSTGAAAPTQPAPTP